MLRNGAIDINRVFREAVASGNRDIIDQLISKGANDWNGGVVAAVKRNDADLVRFMISLRAFVGTECIKASKQFQNPEIISMLLLACNDSFKIGRLYSLPKDESMIVYLLQSTAVPRSLVSQVRKIQKRVFDRLDRQAARIRDVLVSLDWPTVLPSIVVDYSLNLQ